MTGERPEEIEREIERDRAEIGHTVEAIQQRLSPGQLLDQALGYVKTGGGEAASAVVRSARQNPWPLVLTAVSLAWLMRSSAQSNGHVRPLRGDSVSDYARRSNAAERARAAAAAVKREAAETEHSFQARVVEAKARALALKREASESAEAFKERVEDYFRRAEESASSLLHRTRSAVESGSAAAGEQARALRSGASDAQLRAKEFYEAEPLVAGVVGVIAGTLIGALLPSTRTEDRLIGAYGEEMRHRAADRASAAVERSKAAAAEGVRAAAETAGKDI